MEQEYLLETEFSGNCKNVIYYDGKVFSKLVKMIRTRHHHSIFFQTLNRHPYKMTDKSL